MQRYMPAWTAIMPNRFYDEPVDWQSSEWLEDLVLLSKRIAELDALWRISDEGGTGCSLDH